MVSRLNVLLVTYLSSVAGLRLVNYIMLIIYKHEPFKL